MKKTLSFLLLILFTIITVGCSTDNKEEAKEFNLEEFKEEIKSSKSFDITYTVSCNTILNADDITYTFNEDFTTKITVVLTDDKYNLELDTLEKISVSYSTIQTESSSGFLYRLIDGLEYYQAESYGVKSKWFKEEEAFCKSVIATDFLYTLEKQSDLTGFITEIANGIKNEKDSTNNYLLTEEFSTKAFGIANYYTYYKMNSEDVETLETKAYFSESEKALVLESVNTASAIDEASNNVINATASLKFDNFKQEKVTIVTPTEEEFFSGVVFDDTLTDGDHIVELETYLGITDGILRFRNADGELYFLVVFIIVGEANYDEPLEITVLDYYGWNGEILGSAIPYSTYFDQNKTFQLTLHSDGTYSVNILSLPEIYDWYHNDYSNE